MKFKFPQIISLLVISLSSGYANTDKRERSRSHHSNPVTVNYPTKIMEVDEWRTIAEFSPQLSKQSEDSQSWKALSKAQDQEDIWLFENFFYGMQNGIIMESGALDGVLFSTSLLYEKHANWTAIHVEADPENYNKLIHNRPNAINIHGALCSEQTPLHYTSTGNVGVRGFIELMSPAFLQRWHSHIFNNITHVEDLPTVLCMPVRKLMKVINVKHIDLWILDVEGAEESVLKGVDFNALHINAIAMECDEHDPSKNKRKEDILTSNNFKCKLVERNCMCLHNDFTPSAAINKSILKRFDRVPYTNPYNQTVGIKK